MDSHTSSSSSSTVVTSPLIHSSSLKTVPAAIEDHGVRFVRRLDGVTYEFIRDGDAYGFPSYRRIDLDLWCRRLPHLGWVVCADSDQVSSRPFDDAGLGSSPPEGIWVSRKGDRSYVYEMIRGAPRDRA